MNYAEMFNRILSADYTHGAQGVDYLITIDGQHKIVEIIFQGSTTKEDWQHNFDFLPRKVKPYKNMKKAWYAHRGFVEMYHAVRDDILDEVSLCDDFLFVIVGHSQGGALAQLCAEDMAYRDRAVLCYTFGSPRVFYGIKTMRHFDGMRMYVKCLENGSDIVPHLPLFGFNLNKNHIGEKFSLFKIGRTAEYHMGYGDEKLYEVENE